MNIGYIRKAVQKGAVRGIKEENLDGVFSAKDAHLEKLAGFLITVLSKSAM